MRRFFAGSLGRNRKMNTFKRDGQNTTYCTTRAEIRNRSPQYVVGARETARKTKKSGKTGKKQPVLSFFMARDKKRDIH